MADLQFLNIRVVARFCVLLLVANLFVGTVFSRECHAWIFFYKPEYKGQVIDAETGEPIEGVAVVAVYSARNVIGGPAGPNSWKINWRETQTDENGYFRIPPYKTLVGLNSKADETRFIFYKPGYRSSPVWEGRQFLWILGPDTFFTEETGKKEEQEFGIKKEKETITYGVIALRPAEIWSERKRAMPSLPFESDAQELPAIYNYRENEREWLRHNKDWRRHEGNQ